MAAAKSQTRKVAEGYLEKTHRPLNCLIFILPLLTAYEVGTIFFRDGLLAPGYLSAALRAFGATGRYLPAGLVVVVLFFWHVLSRQKWHIDGDALGGMLAESVLWMIPIFGVHLLTVRLLGPVALTVGAQGGTSLPAEILTAIGAGIYEEFLFRLVAVGAVFFVLVDVFRAPKRPVLVAAILIGSLLFSAVHFLDSREGWRWSALVFRAAAGMYLSVLYVVRGFGVAVGAHACYNVAVRLFW